MAAVDTIDLPLRRLDTAFLLHRILLIRHTVPGMDGKLLHHPDTATQHLHPPEAFLSAMARPKDTNFSTPSVPVGERL
jgi:hypothetical protein